ncbi:MAG: hypothetical protein WCK35_16800 [Chloroflexota bacterium]
MDYKKAVRVAVAAMLKDKKSCAVEANLYLNYGARNPASCNAYAHYVELVEAIRVLQS